MEGTISFDDDEEEEKKTPQQLKELCEHFKFERSDELARTTRIRVQSGLFIPKIGEDSESSCDSIEMGNALAVEQHSGTDIILTDVEEEPITRTTRPERLFRKGPKLRALIKLRKRERKIAMLKEETKLQKLKLLMMQEEHEMQHQLFRIQKRKLLIRREMLLQKHNDY